MSPSYLLDENGIKDMVKNGKPIEIVFPILNNPLQESIHFLVDTILHQYGRVDMKECIYTSLKELVINGIKANIKHIIFQENGIDTLSEKSLDKGLLLLKDLMNEKNIGELEKKAIARKLTIKLNILHSRDRIILIVENNTPMTDIEEKRVREKFEAALKYESIADYYMNNLDDSEGQGIGITMIVLMLKGNQIDPHAFTFDMKKRDATRAKIEFPMREPHIITRNTH
jgi:hypothetical protein